MDLASRTLQKEQNIGLNLVTRTAPKEQCLKMNQIITRTTQEERSSTIIDFVPRKEQAVKRKRPPRTKKTGIIVQDRGEANYVCCHCPMSFHEAATFRVHQMHHDGMKLYSCGECYKQFTALSTVRNHMRIHTGRLAAIRLTNPK